MRLGVLIFLVLSLALPVNAQTQQPGKAALWLGLLGLFTPEIGIRSVAAIRQGLGDLGWHEGRNMHFEHQYASGKRDRLGALAAELVEQKVDVMIAFGTDATRAARGVTSSIPIVMAAVGDPVASGFVSNLARPGGNVTGMSLVNSELVGKQLQLLKEVAPRTSRVALISFGAPMPETLKEAEAATRRYGVAMEMRPER